MGTKGGKAVLVLLEVAAVVSGLCAYIVGYAFIAPRSSLVRTPVGGLLLGVLVLVALGGPPMITSVLVWVAPDRVVATDLGAYRVAWVALTAGGLLLGMRAWRMVGALRDGGMLSLDESPASRARAQLLLADSFDAALDVLERERLSAKDLERIAPYIMQAGSRFFHQLPSTDSAVYALVREHVGGEAASRVTAWLLEGAKPRD